MSKEKGDILALENYQADDFISMNQFFVGTPGQLLTVYGWEGDHNQSHDVVIVDDASTGAIWVEHQVSLGADKTKIHFEE